MTQRRVDDLVDDYLARVRAAGAALPPGQLEELIDDLREHIAAARAELAPETEAGVRTLLDRVGDPAAIVAEAAAGNPPRPAPPPAPRTNRAVATFLIVVLAAVALLVLVACVGGLLYAVNSGTSSIVVETGEVPTPTPRPS